MKHYVYLHHVSGMFPVGYYDTEGNFIVESEHVSEYAAAARVRVLNEQGAK